MTQMTGLNDRQTLQTVARRPAAKRPTRSEGVASGHERVESCGAHFLTRHPRSGAATPRPPGTYLRHLRHLRPKVIRLLMFSTLIESSGASGRWNISPLESRRPPARAREHTLTRRTSDSGRVTYDQRMEPSPADGLTEAQAAWAKHSESLWATARRTAEVHPHLDAGDIYHALRCLELTPRERLRQGLSGGRLRAHAR